MDKAERKVAERFSHFHQSSVKLPGGATPRCSDWFHLPGAAVAVHLDDYAKLKTTFVTRCHNNSGHLTRHLGCATGQADYESNRSTRIRRAGGFEV